MSGIYIPGIGDFSGIFFLEMRIFFRGMGYPTKKPPLLNSVKRLEASDPQIDCFNKHGSFECICKFGTKRENGTCVEFASQFTRGTSSKLTKTKVSCDSPYDKMYEEMFEKVYGMPYQQEDVRGFSFDDPADEGKIINGAVVKSRRDWPWIVKVGGRQKYPSLNHTLWKNEPHSLFQNLRNSSFVPISNFEKLNPSPNYKQSY